MELVLYLIAIVFISVGSFWVLGFLYGIIRKPRIYFPFSLAAKMAITAVLGAYFYMVGGIVLSTLVFNVEMKKRDDYQLWPTVIVGVLISILCTVLIYFSVIHLAWAMLE